MKLDTLPNYAESASESTTTPGQLTPIGSPLLRPDCVRIDGGTSPHYADDKPGSENHHDAPTLTEVAQSDTPDSGFYGSSSYSQDGTLPLEEARCLLLPTRSAIWITRGSGANIRLSALAAAVLIKEGYLKPKDLDLYRPSTEYLDDGPSDPISGILGATHGVVGGVIRGVVDYPIEITRMVQQDLPVAKAMAVEFALDSGKGVSGIIGAGLRAPMDVTMGASRGFHNMPKWYGDEVRREERVTGFRSGLKAGGMGLGYGVWDGVTGIFTQPYKGARDGGLIGGLKGIGKGIGGVVCKPAAGAIGLPAYAFKGAYEGIQNIRGVGSGGDEYEIAISLRQGKQDMKATTEEERKFVVEKWNERQNLVADEKMGEKYQRSGESLIYL